MHDTCGHDPKEDAPACAELLRLKVPGLVSSRRRLREHPRADGEGELEWVGMAGVLS